MKRKKGRKKEKEKERKRQSKKRDRDKESREYNPQKFHLNVSVLPTCGEVKGGCPGDEMYMVAGDGMAALREPGLG